MIYGSSSENSHPQPLWRHQLLQPSLRKQTSARCFALFFFNLRWGVIWAEDVGASANTRQLEFRLVSSSGSDHTEGLEFTKKMASHLEVARVLQGRLHDLEAGDSSTDLREILEVVAEEFGIERDEYDDGGKRRKTSSREEAVRSAGDVGEAQVCRHSCREHKEVMNPYHWGTLCNDMLELVFAHLPLNKIIRLRSLSRDWNESLTARGSYFLHVCDKAHPKMFAIIRRVTVSDLFKLRVFDTISNTWHAFRFSSVTAEAGYGHLLTRHRHMSCEDGGLVLLHREAHGTSEKPRVLQRKGWSRSFFYTVVNPLTGSSRQLPPILNVTNVTMKHFMANRETNCYKVLIMVNRSGEEDTEYSAQDIQVFDSETGEWSQPNEATDIMFGNQSAHDFAIGRLLELRTWPETRGIAVESYTLLKDRLYVLRRDSDGPASDVPTNRPSVMYYIREYALGCHPQHRSTLPYVETHRCVPFEHIPKCSGYRHRMSLSSFNGFLVVFSALNELKPYNHTPGWIYDLATRTWRKLPEFPGCLWKDYIDDVCEIRWNAHA